MTGLIAGTAVKLVKGWILILHRTNNNFKIFVVFIHPIRGFFSPQFE